MIEIKTLFNGWIPVTKEKAMDYAKFLYKNITTMNDDECIKYINAKKVKGISFKKKDLEQ